MATISIDVPNAVAARVADAFIAKYPPAPGVAVGTSAEKLAYVKSLLIAHAKGVVEAHESSVAADTARKAAADKASVEVNPT